MIRAVVAWYSREIFVLSRASQYTVLWSNGSQTHPRRGRGKPVIMESVCLCLWANY